MIFKGLLPRFLDHQTSQVISRASFHLHSATRPRSRTHLVREACLLSSFTQHSMARSEPSRSSAGTIHGPMGQNVSIDWPHVSTYDW